MRYANGAVYEGSWKDDKREGQGVMRLANGAVYEGYVCWLNYNH